MRFLDLAEKLLALGNDDALLLLLSQGDSEHLALPELVLNFLWGWDLIGAA